MQVILLAAISVDGKIAERTDQTSLDWTSKEDTKFFVEKTKEVGVVIMGRKTFETIGKPLKGRRVIVLSREVNGMTPASGPADSSRLFPSAGDHAVFSVIPPEGIVEYVNLSPHHLLKRLENEGHDAVVVAGGSSVYSQFLRDGLVTDLYLTVEPVLFGTGISFSSDVDRINMQFVEMRMLGSQSILLHYRLH